MTLTWLDHTPVEIWKRTPLTFGTSGGSGTSGTSGESGSAGTSGSSSNGTSGTSGINGVDSSLSLKWELQDTAGANPTGSSYFSACCNSGLSNTGIFKFAYTSKTIPAEGFWNTIASAISSGLTPYMQIVQIGDNNVIGLYEIASVNYSDPGNSGQYNVNTNGVPAIYGNGLWSVGEEYAVSFSLAGAPGQSGTSGQSGTAGTSGTSGTSGSSGQTGAAGTSGTSGNGTSGTSSNGTSGSSGSSGSTGTGGSSGSSGSTGTSGSSGNGTAGTSGTSFSSPYSGNLNGTAGQSWMSSFGATTSINWNNGNVQTRTLAASETFTFENPNNGATYILVIKQAAAGGYTITWPTINWLGGAPPTMTATANKTDIYTFLYANSTYYGSYAQNF
jgi:hypothetical protein